MLRIWYSNRLEQLVDQLAGNMGGGDASAGRLEPARILVANWNVKRFLQLQIARRRGIAINLRFDRLRQFSANAALGEAESLLGRDRLKAALFEALRRPEVLAGEEMAPVRRYLAAAGGQMDPAAPASLVGPIDETGWSVDDPELDSRERRRFQLAGRVASLFEEYSFSRPEMLRRWPDESYMADEFEGSAPERFERVEAWQSTLWGAVFGEEGLLASIHEGGETTYRTLWELYYGKDAEATPSLNVPGRVHIFGLSYMARLFGHVLTRFAEETETHLYALNPCKEYWGDLRTGRLDEEHVFSSEAVTGGTMGREGGTWELETENPALRQWGRPGRDHFWMLQRLEEDPGVDAQIDEVYPSPLFEEAGLLKHIQNDIRIRRGEKVGRAEESVGGQAVAESGGQGDDQPRLFEDRRHRPTLQADETIQFVRAPGVQREVETVARRIWQVVESDAAVDFQDVAVIVNHHESERYIPKLESAFERMRDIPYNVVDLSAKGASRVIEAAEMLLALPFGDFRRDEFLKLLVHPAVRAAFPGVEPSEWVEWCEQLNIIRGVDRDDQRDTYIDADVFNWSQGMKRLLLGTFMADESEGTESRLGEPVGGAEAWSVFEHEGSAYLPEEVNPGRAPDAARFMVLAESMIRDVEAARDRTASLSEWAGWFSRMVDTYITPETDEDEEDVLSLFEAIESVGELDVAGEPISYRAAHEFIAEKLEDLEVRRGQYLADGVVVSSFLPMRPLPFEYVFAVGLGEETFPTTDPNTPLDLRTAKWVRGDVGPRDQDRYMFLETLISTRKRLCLSWVGRDPTTGDPLEPSSIIRELQQMLELFGVDPDECTTEPPLRRFEAGAYSSGLEDAPFDGPGGVDGQNDGEGAEDAESGTVIDAEAYREAQIRALRRRASAQGVGVPSMAELREQLDDDARDLLERRLRVTPELTTPEIPPFIREEAESGRRPRLRLSISKLRKFLETPLQGGARVRPGLREIDDDDPFDRRVEPFEIDVLQKNVVGRRVFRRALEAPLASAEIEALYESETRRAMLRGDFPAGMFGQMSRASMIRMLQTWKSNAAVCGVDGSRAARVVGFGDRTADANESHPALIVEVPLAGLPAASNALMVELHGTLQPWSPASGRIPVATTSKKAKPKYFCRGHLTNVLLRAAGLWEAPPDGEAGMVVSLPVEQLEAGDAPDYQQQVVDWDQDDATAYLSELIGALVGETHEYVLPIELVDSYVEALREGERPDLGWLQTKLDKMFGGYRTRGSSQYGPVENPADRAPPEAFERVIRQRYRMMYPDVLGGEGM